MSNLSTTYVPQNADPDCRRHYKLWATSSLIDVANKPVAASNGFASNSLIPAQQQPVCLYRQQINVNTQMQYTLLGIRIYNARVTKILILQSIQEMVPLSVTRPTAAVQKIKFELYNGNICRHNSGYGIPTK